MNALLTDLYELTMAAGYFETGRSGHKATFEFAIRHLPPHRNFVLAAGLPQVVDYLLNLRFDAEEIDYLRGLAQFQRVSPGFFDYLAQFRFTGDLFAVPEGTPLFAGEPLLLLRAPIVEAQIPETYVLSALSFPSLIASKAARMVEAAGGRPVVEFGTRRAHTPDAGVLGARAAYIGGCSATSNALAGSRYGIPVAGTAAHSWVMSFCSEISAFRHLQQVMGEHATHVIDTYDPLEGARRVAQLGRPLWGVRLDSGDLLALSRQVRGILDEGGLPDALGMPGSGARLAHCASTNPSSAWLPVMMVAAIGWWRPTVGSSHSATHLSRDRWAPITSTSPSSAWLPPTTGGGTGSWRPTGGSSRLGMQPSRGRSGQARPPVRSST